MTERKIAEAYLIRTEEKVNAQYETVMEEFRAKCEPILKELFDACTGNYKRPDWVLEKVLTQVTDYALRKWSDRPGEVITTIHIWAEDFMNNITPEGNA